MAAASVDSARREWEDGYRRLLATAREPCVHERLQSQVQLVTDELSRRVGQTFTLGELAAAYREAERWSRAVLGERAPEGARPEDLSLVEDAAFHLYSRGASDYAP